MPILIAVMVCLFLATILTLPWAIYQYRKYGYFSFWKTILALSFIFYGLSAYFLVIYPLPVSRNNCSLISPDAVFAQLRPFQFIRDIQRETSVNWAVPSSYIALLKARAFYQMFFNILLLFPLGVFLRYFFKKKGKWLYAVLIGFGVSLFFELTQRTALYGIYECPYRIFDVDDLMTNTLGTVLGFFFAPVFLILIPSRETLVEQKQMYSTQKSAAYGAQLFEVVLNVILASIVTNFVLGVTKQSGVLAQEIGFAAVLFVLMVVVPALWNGYTVGSKVLHIRLVPEKENGKGSFTRRFFSIYMPFLVSALAKVFSLYKGEDLLVLMFVIGISFLAGLTWLFVLGHVAIRWIKNDEVPYFNRYGQVRAIRDIRIK